MREFIYSKILLIVRCSIILHSTKKRTMLTIWTVRYCCRCSTLVPAYFLFAFLHSVLCLRRQTLMNCFSEPLLPCGFWLSLVKESTIRKLNGGRKMRLIVLFPWLFPAGSQNDSGYIPLLMAGYRSSQVAFSYSWRYSNHSLPLLLQAYE